MRLTACGLSSLLSFLLVSSAFASGTTMNTPMIENPDYITTPNYTPRTYYYQDNMPLDNFVYGCSPGYTYTVTGGCVSIIAIDSSGDVDLDKAMTICHSHRINDGITYLYNETYGKPYAYDDKWKNCTKIDEKWSKTKAGLEEKKRLEKEQKDLDFVNQQAEK